MKKEKKLKPEVRSIENIMANKSDASKLNAFIDEAVVSKTKIATENEHIKTIKEDALEAIGLDPKMFSFLVKEAYNRAFEETKQDLSEKEFAIEAVFGSSQE